MKCVSWNVNGLRACVGKGFMEFFEAMDADFFALQETKLQPDQIDLQLLGYHQYFHSAQKKGYSGTAVFTKHTPLRVMYDFPHAEFEPEGRVITLEMEDFFFVTAYVPNSQDGLKRLDTRLLWEQALRDHLVSLDAQKPVIYCGDLNVAHQEIDLKNPKQNRLNAGFTDQERAAMTALLEAGFVDSFRALNPDLEGAYSWWSYRFNARANNAGWRIDYFLLSRRLLPQLRESNLHADVLGSDHCPVSLVLESFGG